MFQAERSLTKRFNQNKSMKNKFSFRSAFCLLAVHIGLAALFTGCATPEEHSYNKEFGENLPAQPMYSIKKETDDHFTLYVHQGVPLSGAGRTLNVKEATSAIAKAECERLGWKKWDLNYVREQDQGWMHVVVARVDRKPYIEPSYPGSNHNP